MARIVTFDGDLDLAVAGQSVTLTLADEIDVSRGDVLGRGRRRRPQVADQFEAHIVWMGEEPMLPGRPYLIKMRRPGRSRRRSPSPKYTVNVNTLEQRPATTLELNEIGVCNITLDRRRPLRRLHRQP